MIKENVLEIIEEEISNLEDFLGIGLPEGGSTEAITHSIQTLISVKEKVDVLK